jgi:hypothetical protein
MTEKDSNPKRTLEGGKITSKEYILKEEEEDKGGILGYFATKLIISKGDIDTRCEIFKEGKKIGTKYITQVLFKGDFNMNFTLKGEKSIFRFEKKITCLPYPSGQFLVLSN